MDKIGCNISTETYEELQEFYGGKIPCIQIFLPKESDVPDYSGNRVYVHTSFNTVMNKHYCAPIFQKQYMKCKGYRGIILHLPSNDILNKYILSKLFMNLPVWDDFTIYFEHVIGRYCDPNTFSQVIRYIRKIAKKINPHLNIGAVIDTCHVYSSGIDILAYKGFDCGGNTLIHLNDSVNEFNSGVDRHAELGRNLFTKKILEEFLDGVDAVDYIIELKMEGVKDSIRFIEGRS